MLTVFLQFDEGHVANIYKTINTLDLTILHLSPPRRNKSSMTVRLQVADARRLGRAQATRRSMSK